MKVTIEVSQDELKRIMGAIIVTSEELPKKSQIRDKQLLEKLKEKWDQAYDMSSTTVKGE